MKNIDKNIVNLFRRSIVVLYHPFLGLWNWNLVAVIKKYIPLYYLQKIVIAVVAVIDTVILGVRVLQRRIVKTGLSGVFQKERIPVGMRLYYFDLGTHSEAKELTFMVEKVLPVATEDYRAFGFEASAALFEKAKEHLDSIKHVTMLNLAVCEKKPKGGKLKLYKDNLTGLGNSIYRNLEAEFESVEAIPLSEFIHGNSIDIRKNICLLRMNIEGAEFDVIKDLVSSGLAASVDGYFGVWEDVFKTDSQRGDEFYSLLLANHISPVTFNGSDFLVPMRLSLVKYDIRTAIISGVKNKYNSS